MTEKVIPMDVAAVAIQQVMLQNSLGLSMLKNTAQTEQAVVNMVQQAAQGGRGGNLDITV